MGGRPGRVSDRGLAGYNCPAAGGQWASAFPFQPACEGRHRSTVPRHGGTPKRKENLKLGIPVNEKKRNEVLAL